MFCWPPIFDVVGSKKYRRPAPLTPAAMARLVARKRFTSKKGDLPMVIALNTRTILSIFRGDGRVQCCGLLLLLLLLLPAYGHRV